MARTYVLVLGAALVLVGAVSLIYLPFGVLGFVAPLLSGLLLHSYAIVDNIIHAALGILGLLVCSTSWLPAAKRSAASRA